WLDVVRYAETNSFERDGAKPNAWKYRDYVIRSLNDDKPYDQFLREQLAGDELDQVTVDSMTATGFYRLGIWDDEPADPLQSRYDELDDIVATIGKSMLGLTINCARCHDHKIDPMPQADYYGMLAFLADVTPYGERGNQQRNSQWDVSQGEVRAARRRLKRREEKVVQLKVSIEETGVKRMSAPDQRRSETHEREALLVEKLEGSLNASEWQQYQDTLTQLADIHRQLEKLPAPEAVLALARCEPHPPATHILTRGNPHAPGDEVQPHFPEIFQQAAPELPAAGPNARTAGRRRVLAEWVASKENLLTARVIVNRVWQHHFGRGIVRSASNFGVLGDPPTHPELLDFLAVWLMDHEWRLKPLHRLIMTSEAYRQSSAGRDDCLAADPQNDSFWRYDLHRLSAEEVRDSVLAVSGRLNRGLYGPSFYSLISADAMSTQSRPGDGWGTSSPRERSRRSVYIHVKRSLVTPLLSAFDFPDTDVSCEARFMTTQPAQALSMVNGAFLNEQAAALAERVRSEAGDAVQSQTRRAIELALQRDAEPEEVSAGLDLIERMRSVHGVDDDAALKMWCLTVLNLNEFMYLD
ncbi:MAG: DUF1553 domain-containing protein, partial [Planctomycetales bacterium]|nr:DUF1553 domain-containing protein [Planctomycetales bacterium]